MGQKLARVCGWIIAGCVLVVILVAGGVGFYTQTESFRLWLKAQTVAALQPAIKGELTLERVSGSIWTAIQLHNIAVRQNGVDVITIPQAGLTLHLLPQLYTLVRSGSFHIARLALTAPRLTLWQEPDGDWNMSGLFEISDEPQEPAIFVDRIQVADGRVDVRQATGEEAHLTALSLEGSLAVSTGAHVQLSQLAFSFSHPRVPPLHGAGGLSYDDTISPAVLRVQDLDLRTPHSQVRLSGIVRDLAAPTTELAVTVTPLAASEVRTVLPTLPLREDLSGNLQLTGPLSALRVNAAVAAQNGRITASGTVNLTEMPPRYQGQVEVGHLVIDKVLHLPNLAGAIRGRFSLRGSGLEPTQATLQARASDLLVQGWAIESADLTGELQKEQFVVTAQARGKNGDARLQGAVTLGRLPHYEATVEMKNLNIARVTRETQETPPLTGPLNLDARIKGSGLDPETLSSSANITFRSSQIGPVALTHGEVVGTLHQGQLTLTRLTLLAKNTTLTAQGKIGIRGHTPDGHMTYAVAAKDIAPWLTLAGLRGTGQLQLNGTAKGPLTDLRLEGKASASNLRVDASSVQSGTLTWTLTGIGSQRPQGHVTATLSHLNAGMEFHTVSTDLTLSGRHPVEIQASTKVQATDKQALAMQTTLRYDGGRVDAHVQSATLRLPSGVWRTPQPAQLLLHAGTLTISNFQLQRGEQRINAAGVLARHGSQDLHVQVQRFPLAELQPFFPDDGPDVSGYLSADVSVRGTAARPELEASLTAESLTVAGQSYAGLTAHGTYQQDYLRLNALLRQDPTHSLTLAGGLPRSLGWGEERVRPVLGEANLHVYSDGLSLAFLSLLSSEIRDVTGIVSMDVRVGGTLDAPVPAGEIRVQGGQVRVLPLGTLLKNIEVRLGLTQNEIHISQLAVSAGKGQLTGSGTLALQRYTVSAIDLTLNAERFRVINTREYTVAVSGRLLGAGSVHSPLLRGALTLQDTTFHPDLSGFSNSPVATDPTIIVAHNLEDLALQSSRTPHPQEQNSGGISFPQLQHELYQQLRLDVAVTIPRDTWVQMHDGSIELMGNLQIRKNPTEEVTVSGTIETVRGWYGFYGRQFQIEKGQVIFTGGSTLDPGLDIIARYTLPRYKVDVVIGGTADTPTLTLRSDPSLDQADILSLLAFGKPANALNQGEKVSLQAQALQITAGYIASDLRQSVAQRLGIDSLEVDVAERRFGVGKYVTKDVYVSTSQQFGSEQKQNVSIEYQLDTDWQLRATTDSQGNSGIDLFWQKQY